MQRMSCIVVETLGDRPKANLRSPGLEVLRAGHPENGTLPILAPA